MTFHFNCSKFSTSWRSVGMTANVRHLSSTDILCSSAQCKGEAEWR